MANLFISYCHDDLATARRFAEGLEREGFTVWWDASLRSGDAFDVAIENALRSAEAVIVLSIIQESLAFARDGSS